MNQNKNSCNSAVPTNSFGVDCGKGESKTVYAIVSKDGFIKTLDGSNVRIWIDEAMEVDSAMFEKLREYSGKIKFLSRPRFGKTFSTMQWLKMMGLIKEKKIKLCLR